MLNFAPTEEQEEIRNLAQSLASEQLRPHAREAEKRGDISPELMQTLAQTGLTTPFPEAYGGSGPIEATTYTLIAEELGYGDGALAMNIIGSLMGPLAVALAGTEQQQQRYIPPFCDPQKGYLQRGSFAFAERTGGYALADIQTTLRREGTNWRINGTKRNVIHGHQSDLLVVLARLEGCTGADGLCAVVVPTPHEGLSIKTDEHKLGLAAAPSAALVFEHATVPEILGDPGHSGALHAATLYQILRAGIACGMASAGLEYARDYAKGRYAFGRPIASYQGIAFMVSEMAMKIDAARLLLWRAAHSWDQAKQDHIEYVREADIAQHQAVKIAKSATLDAIQILGGAGFLQDHPVEMWARNAAAME